MSTSAPASSPPEFETIHIDRRGEVDWLTLNLPESLNAINEQMLTDLRDYYGGLAENAPVRIVVMRGAGRAFCGGLREGGVGGTTRITDDRRISRGSRLAPRQRVPVR